MNFRIAFRYREKKNKIIIIIKERNVVTTGIQEELIEPNQLVRSTE